MEAAPQVLTPTDTAVEAGAGIGTRAAVEVQAARTRGFAKGSIPWNKGKGSGARYPKVYVRGQDIEVHRHLAEVALGRPLPVEAEVHHVDYDKRNSANSNLVICEDRRYHSLLHYRTDAYRATGDPDSLKCCVCKQWDRSDNVHVIWNSSQGRRGRVFHLECRKQYDRNRRAIIKEGRSRGL